MGQSIREVFILDAVRTATGRGRPGGSLSSWHPVDLMAEVLLRIQARSGLDPLVVDDVIGGVVTPVGEQGGNLMRQAVLAAGFPEATPAVTIDRKCGSSQQAAHFAAHAIASGVYEVAIAGGVEMLSRVRMQSNTAGADYLGARLTARYTSGLPTQGIAAERVAKHWKLSREELDAFSLQSHHRAWQATENGLFANEIVPLVDAVGAVIDRDEGIRANTSLDALSRLPPAFHVDDAKHSDLPWVITAGNSSQISDGASAVILASPEFAARTGIRPRAKMVALAVTGDDPTMMLTGVIPATRKALDQAGLRISDIDLFEVNEAFASVVLAWQREFGVDAGLVNVNGGAIALGHPLGATGTRILATLVNALEHRDVRFGLQVTCEAGGQANATIIERIG